MGTKHTVEFRQEAVRVVLTSGVTRKQVASDFGIGFSTLSRWVQQDRKTVFRTICQSDLERELAMLHKENLFVREGSVKKATIHWPAGHVYMPEMFLRGSRAMRFRFIDENSADLSTRVFRIPRHGVNLGSGLVKSRI